MCRISRFCVVSATFTFSLRRLPCTPHCILFNADALWVIVGPTARVGDHIDQYWVAHTEKSENTRQAEQASTTSETRTRSRSMIDLGRHFHATYRSPIDTIDTVDSIARIAGLLSCRDVSHFATLCRFCNFDDDFRVEAAFRSV
jgi:hypothetical protein